MNTDDEGQLRGRLDAALAQIDPGPLPLDAVFSQGRAVMIRRRVLAAAAAVAVAAATFAVPTLTRYLAHPPPSAPTGYHVTVQHPGKETSQHVIAYGRVTTSLNDMRWSVSGAGSGPDFRLHWQTGSWRLYVGGELYTIGAGSWEEPIPSSAPPVNPVSVLDVAYAAPALLALAVRADVSYLVVGLSNGQAVTLRPVAVGGPARPRLAAIAVPSQTSITEIRAYSAAGELGYTVPYGALSGSPSPFRGSPGGDFQIVRWLSPGQPALPAAGTYPIGRGTLRGYAWSEQLKIGPWGTCVSAPTGPPDTCYPAIGRGLLGGKVAVTLASDSFSQDHAGWDAIVVELSVSSIVVRTPSGRMPKVRLYSHDGVKFAMIAWSSGEPPTNWIAYSASGKVLGSGPI